MCAWRECACSVWRGGIGATLLLLVIAALTSADMEEKRSDMSPMPFVMGSRYGRSSGGPKMIVPRNDRFFMGSRYGKRSEAPGARAAAMWGAAEPGLSSAESVGGAALLCEYTGVFPLYRCVKHHKRDNSNARSADEPDTDEEK